ncbi:MAG TPA: helix-turn-helix domain-containing protein [Candidatus Obscuribacterales bacterium]
MFEQPDLFESCLLFLNFSEIALTASRRFHLTAQPVLLQEFAMSHDNNNGAQNQGARSSRFFQIQSDPLLTRREAAEYLGVTPETLAIWHCTKRYPLPIVKIGRLAKYKKSDLDAFIASRRIAAG